MGDPTYEEVTDAVSRRKLRRHPAAVRAAREQLTYRFVRHFTELPPAQALLDRVHQGGAYSASLSRVVDRSACPYVERLADGRLAMGYNVSTAPYVLPVW